MLAFKKILTVIFILISCKSYSTIHYVSKNGNSNNDGLSYLKPWDYNKYTNSYLPPGDTILFNRGEIFYGSFMIKKGSSGKEFYYGAYGFGANPKFSGFKKLTSWTLFKGNIYYSTLHVKNINLVTLNDKVQAMGRFPKTIYNHYTSHNGNTSITDPSLIGTNWVGAEVVIRKYRWIIDRHKVTSQLNGILTYDANKNFGNNSYYQPVNGNGYFIQNHLNCLTAFGDWYFDSTNQKFYMDFGNKTPNANTVNVSATNVIAYINNGGYLNVNNLDFEGSNYSGIEMNSANNITFNNCNFIKHGGNGLHGNTVVKLIVNGGSFTDCLNNSIKIELNAKNCSITNSTISNSGIIAGAGLSGDGNQQAIDITGSGTYIANNTIKNTGYNAIKFSGENILIEHNLIDTFCIIKDDGAGIYTYMAPGLIGGNNIVVRSNIILNGVGAQLGTEAYSNYEAFGKAAGIYLDGASNIQLLNNTIAHNAWHGILMNGVGGNSIINNFVYDALQVFGINIYVKGAFRNNKVIGNNFIAKDSNQKVININLYIFDSVSRFGRFDSNYYARPLDDNFTIEICNKYAFSTCNEYNLEGWKSLSSLDVSSNKSSITASKYSNQRFDYNYSNTPTTIYVNPSFDIQGNNYTNFEILKPYTGNVLFSKSLISTITFIATAINE